MAKRNPHKSAYAKRREYASRPGSPEDTAAREAAVLFKPGVPPELCGPGTFHHVIRMILAARSKAERQLAALCAYQGMKLADAGRVIGLDESRAREVYKALVERLRQAEDRHRREEILAKNGV